MNAPSRRSLAQYAVVQLLDPKVSPAKLARSLGAALVSFGKQKEADLLLADIAEELESRQLLAQATVTSAHVLSVELKKQLGDYVKRAAKVKQVVLEESLDENVIGGMRIETAKHTWDKTIAGQLNQIKGEI